MSRFLIISAIVHVFLLVLVPFIPGLLEEDVMGLESYTVELVELSPPPREAAPEPEPVVQEEIREPVQEEPVVEEQIPIDPPRRVKRVTLTPPPRHEKTLEERLAERLRAQDEAREDETKPEERVAEEPAATSAVVTASRFPYSWYLSIIQGKVRLNWKQPSSRLISNEKLSAQISFRIVRSGDIEVVTVRRSSGLQNVDHSAVTAVRDSAPFPPLPDDYMDDHLDVTIDFTVARN
ncbi:TonB family protein [bacterium]|nr:TonB family protein [bacterium]